MKHFFIVFVFFFLQLFCGCNENTTLVSTELQLDSILADTTPIAADTNQYLYDFIKMVEKDQKLDYSYGLTLEPNSDLSSTEDDSYLWRFLKTKAETIKKETKKKDTLSKDTTQIALQDTSTFILTPNEPLIFKSLLYPNYIENKYLTKADIKYMLAEKRRLKGFKWNNQRLGFNLANENNWYVFSLPYFSKDKKTVLISIRSLCKPFLCGSGEVLLYRYENNKWTSTQVDSWIH